MGDKNTQFVKCIEKFSCIYNHTDPDYLKRDVSDKAWQEVANEVQIPVSECKEKWKNLRYGLIRSLRLNADGTPKRKYYLYDDMEFILPYLTTKQHELLSSLDVETDEDKNEEENDLSLQQQYPELEFSEPPRKRSRKNEPVNSNTYYTERAIESQDDSRKMFMLGLMPEINALTDNQMRVFRRRILALLDEVSDAPNELGMWTGNSSRLDSQETVQNYRMKPEPS